MPTDEEKFLAKLRQPVHISFIAKYLLKVDEEEAMEIINKYIELGLVEENEHGKGYYGLTNQ
jgi:hypothetical protein